MEVPFNPYLIVRNAATSKPYNKKYHVLTQKEVTAEYNGKRYRRVEYYILLKTGSLDNAIRELSLA